MGNIAKHSLKAALQAKTAKRRKNAHAFAKIAGGRDDNGRYVA